LCAGQPKTDKAPKVPRAPKQIVMCAVTIWLGVFFTYVASDLTDKTSSFSIRPLRSYRIVSLPFTRYANLVSGVGAKLDVYIIVI
jgi:hypothetical protein